MNAPRPEPAKHLVRVRRDTRWDVYPSREPAETYEVSLRPRRANESEGTFAGRVVDALAAQHAKWRVASPVLLGVEVAS